MVATDLAAVLVATRATPLAADQRAVVEHRLAAIVAIGRQAWPRVAVEGADVARQLAAALPATVDLATALGSLHAADLYLAVGCAHGDRHAISELDARLAHVPDYIARITTDRTCVGDVIQDMRTRLLVGAAPRIARYAGTGALGGWLRIIAVRTALNQRRGAAEPAVPPSAGAPPSPEHALIAARAEAAFRGALTRSLSALAPDDRNLLRFHYFHGFTIDQLATQFQRHRATVIRQLNRIRACILVETRKQLAQDLRLAPAELDHWIDAARSRFELTISRVLR
jgi:RNA polymerase sigma-70 factor (ECF subfamily)